MNLSKINSLYRLPALALCLVIIASAFTLSSAKKKDWDKDARIRKADAMYITAQNAYNTDMPSVYVTAAKRAVLLDSSDIENVGEWAYIQFLVNPDIEIDSVLREKNFNLIYQLFKSNPDNYYIGKLATNIALKFDKYDTAQEIMEGLAKKYPLKAEPTDMLLKIYGMQYESGDSSAINKLFALLDRQEAGNGKNIQTSISKAAAHIMASDTAAAKKELYDLYCSAPNDAKTAFTISEIFSNFFEDNDSALAYLEKACKNDSTNGEILLARAKIYLKMGDSITYERETLKALNSNDLDIDAKLDFVKQFVTDLIQDSLKRPQIINMFDDLQRLHPGEPVVNDYYGSYLMLIHDYPAAAEQYEYATALSPSSDNYWSSMITAYINANDTAKVIEKSHLAFERFPDNIMFPITESSFYRLKGNNKKCLEILENITIPEDINEKTYAVYLISKADAYVTASDTVKALDLYDQAIAIDPTNSMAMNNAAYFMTISHGDLNKAEDYSRRSLASDYNYFNPTYLDTYAWVLFNQKKYPLAKFFINAALTDFRVQHNDTVAQETVIQIVPDQNTDSITASSNDSISVSETDLVMEESEVSFQNEKEIELYRKIISYIDKETKATDFTDDEISFFDEAEFDFNDNVSADILDHAGDIYFMNGDHEKAIRFWQLAHKLDPKDEIIAKKLKHKTIFLR